MSNNTKLIIAFILFLIYGMIAIYSGWLPGSARSVEVKLYGSAQKNLANSQFLSESETGAKDIKLSMSGQKAILSGVARSNDQRKKIIKDVKTARWSGGLIAGGVTKVNARNLKVLPVATVPDAPYIWSAKKEDGPVVLTGMVPDEQTRDALIAHGNAIFPDGVIDRMTITSGAPKGDWVGAARRSLNSLSQLRVGEASGDDTVFRVTGTAANLEIASRARETVRNMPDGYIGEPSIEADKGPKTQSPYLWNARMDGRDAPIILSGYVPDRPTADVIIVHAKSVFSERVVDNMIVAPGVPGEDGLWLDSVKASLTTLAGLQTGRARASDLDFDVTGTATSEERAANARTVMAGLEGDFNGTSNITVVAPPRIEAANVCQSLFDDAMQETTINFETSKSTIKPASYELLGRLSAAAKRCSAFKISIEGHTDSQGGESGNQGLSERRAKAVVDFLVGDGVDLGQLTSRGFGESSPIADNNTAEGRRRNRRIEFKIIQ